MIITSKCAVAPGAKRREHRFHSIAFARECDFALSLINTLSKEGLIEPLLPQPISPCRSMTYKGFCFSDPRKRAVRLTYLISGKVAEALGEIGDYCATGPLINTLKGRDHRLMELANELKRLREPSLEQIRDLVESSIKQNRRLKRKALIYLSRKHTQKILNEIAAFCGKTRDMGVSQAFMTTEKARGQDKKFDNLLANIEKKLKV